MKAKTLQGQKVRVSIGGINSDGAQLTPTHIEGVTTGGSRKEGGLGIRPGVRERDPDTKKRTGPLLPRNQVRLTFKLKDGTVDVIMGDSHALWKSHQEGHGALMFKKLKEMVAEKGAITLEAMATFEELSQGGGGASTVVDLEALGFGF